MAEKIKGVMVAIISVIVLFIVAFSIVGGTASTLVDAGNNVSQFAWNDTSGATHGVVRTLPLQALFAGNGVVFIVFMAGLLITFIAIVLKKRMGGK